MFIFLCIIGRRNPALSQGPSAGTTPAGWGGGNVRSNYIELYILQMTTYPIYEPSATIQNMSVWKKGRYSACPEWWPRFSCAILTWFTHGPAKFLGKFLRNPPALAIRFGYLGNSNHGKVLIWPVWNSGGFQQIKQIWLTTYSNTREPKLQTL